MRLTKSNIAKNSRTVTYQDIVKAHRASKARNLRLQFLDADFRVPNLELFTEMVKKDYTNKRKYRASVADCDNFAGAFASNCGLRWGINSIGFVCDSSAGHAYNLAFVTDSRGILVAKAFEPQTDQFVNIGTKNYKGEKGWVMMF